MRRISQIKRLINQKRNSFTPKAIILMYHRVDLLTNYPYEIVVSPENFYQQINYICSTCHPMRLVDLVANQGKNSFPKRGVVITFDDGYVDVYTQAFPILKELQVPATVFVTLSNIDRQREFWWDDLDRIFLDSAEKSGDLQISLDGKKYEWKTDSLEQRKIVRKEIHSLLRPLSIEERNNSIKALIEWANIPEVGRAKHRTMTSSELQNIQNDGTIDLGAHTINHPWLSSLSRPEQHAEIVKSKLGLEEITGCQIETFAYPYGNYDDNSVDIVKSAGFRAACTTNKGLVRPKIDQFCLPRYPTGDWDLQTFKNQIEKYFNG